MNERRHDTSFEEILGRLLEVVRRIELRLDRLIVIIGHAAWADRERDLETMATLDEVLNTVREEDTKTDSLIALIDGIKQQLADALSGATLPPAVQAKVDEVFATTRANADQLQAAIDANTPQP